MKKSILLLSIITICYACKKESVEPEIQQLIQTPTVDRCQDSGICSEGIYESQNATANTNDSVIYQTGSTTILGQVKLTFKGYGHSPLYPFNDSLIYDVTILNFNGNVIDTTFQYLQYFKYGGTKSFFPLRTKYGNYCRFDFKHH